MARVSSSVSLGASKVFKTKKDSNTVNTRVLWEQSGLCSFLEKTVGGVPAAFIEQVNQSIKRR